MTPERLQELITPGETLLVEFKGEEKALLPDSETERTKCPLSKEGNLNTRNTTKNRDRVCWNGARSMKTQFGYQCEYRAGTVLEKHVEREAFKKHTATLRQLHSVPSRFKRWHIIAMVLALYGFIGGVQYPYTDHIAHFGGIAGGMLAAAMLPKWAIWPVLYLARQRR